MNIDEWKTMLRKHLLSGASEDCWEWVLECALHASENGDVDIDVLAELEAIETALERLKRPWS